MKERSLNVKVGDEEFQIIFHDAAINGLIFRLGSRSPAPFYFEEIESGKIQYGVFETIEPSDQFYFEIESEMSNYLDLYKEAIIKYKKLSPFL